MNQILHLIYNPHSGQGKAQELPELAKKIAHSRGWQVETYKLDKNNNLQSLTDLALQNIKKNGGRLAAAGGDGTLRAVIQKISSSPIEFAIIPSGTFNIFARTHEIPLMPEEALTLAMTGKPEKVRLGSMNEQIFLINGNIGLYAKAIRERKPWVQKFGRNRLVALVATLWAFFKDFRPLKLKLKTHDMQIDVKTTLVFIGNSPLQLESLKLDYGSPKNLACVIVKDLNFRDRLRIIWKGLLGGLHLENKLEVFSLPELEIDAKKIKHKVVLDGESLEMHPPFRVKSLTGALNLIKQSSSHI